MHETTISVPRLLSKRQAAELLGVCLGTVDNLMKRSELSWVYIGRRVMIRVDSINDFIERNSTPQVLDGRGFSDVPPP
jgi:excisionase family DNA binding protein